MHVRFSSLSIRLHGRTLNYITLQTFNVHGANRTHGPDEYVTVVIIDADEKQREKVGIVGGKQRCQGVTAMPEPLSFNVFFLFLF